jgi:DNA-binding CsgD family transcriptional regulator
LAIIKRVWSKTFLKSLGLVLAAEVLVIIISSSLLSFNTDHWIHDKTAQVMLISREASASGDWSLIAQVPKHDGGSRPFKRLHKKIVELSQRFFRTKEGSVFLAVVDQGEEYDIDYGDSDFYDGGKANTFELAAYSTRTATSTSAPVSDDSGTYVAGYTPIIERGNVVGLLGAEYDSAPMADYYEIVRSAFWWSILPAILLSLVISYILANNLPIEVLREIENVRQSSEDSAVANALWNSLTPTQRHVFQLLGQGLKDLEIAAKMHVTLNTVKSHVKSIRAKMKDVVGDDNISRVDLAIVARGILQASSDAP